jgi:putative transposase
MKTKSSGSKKRAGSKGFKKVKPLLSADRFRLYPTPEQEQVFLQISGCCRLVYNKTLEYVRKQEARRREAKRDGVSVEGSVFTDIYEAKKLLTVWKQEHVFLKSVPAAPLQCAVLDVKDAYERFFDGQTEAPTFRRFARAPSFEFPQFSQCKVAAPQGPKSRFRFLALPKVGMAGSLGPVKMKQHRPFSGKVRSVTVKREGGFWFASFRVERPLETHKPDMMGALAARVVAEVPDFKTRSSSEQETILDVMIDALKITGGDFGVRTPLMTSDGVVMGTSVVTSAHLKRLGILQRAVDRKKEALRKAHGIAPGGSLKGVVFGKALRRAQVRLLKFYGKLARIRKDQAHKISRALVDMCDVVALEAIETKKMTSKVNPIEGSTRSRRREILDVSWSQIGAFVEYKARWAGKALVRVDPAYTSQTCFNCRSVEKDNRKNKGIVFKCLSCGHTDNADINAAKNIREKSKEVLRDLLRTEIGRRLETSSLRLGEPGESSDMTDADKKAAKPPLAFCSGNKGSPTL